MQHKIHALQIQRGEILVCVAHSHAKHGFYKTEVISPLRAPADSAKTSALLGHIHPLASTRRPCAPLSWQALQHLAHLWHWNHTFEPRMQPPKWRRFSRGARGN
jgi:hypothetical protein